MIVCVVYLRLLSKTAAATTTAIMMAAAATMSKVSVEVPVPGSMAVEGEDTGAPVPDGLTVGVPVLPEVGVWVTIGLTPAASAVNAVTASDGQ